MHRASELEFRAVGNADEWKRKFQKEIKVNQELGRRIRELKQLLHDEKVERQHLATQFQDYKAQHQCDSCSSKFTKECSKCTKLEEELEKLKRLVAAQNKQQQQQQQQQSNQECEDNASLEATVVQSDDPIDDNGAAPDGEGDPHTSSAPSSIERRCKQGANLHSPNLAAAELRLKLPETLQRDRMQLGNSSMSPGSFQHSHQQPIDQLRQQSREAPPVPSASSAFDAMFVGYEDTSLGELFKYAVVLAGPQPIVETKISKQQKPPLLQRKSFADYRRTRSLPESQQSQLQQSAATADDTAAEYSSSQAQTTAAATPSKFKLLTGGRPSRLTARYSQSLLDFISEEPSPAPSPAPATPAQRKPGWLSNLVSQRFRSTGTTVTAEAPGRLTTTLDQDFQDKQQSVAPMTPASKLVCVYPPQTKQVAELEGLVELCFPYGDALPPVSDFTLTNLKRTLQERHRTYRSPDATFVLTIASSESNPGEVTYAICVICPLFADDEAPEQQMSDAGEPASPTTATTTTTQCCLCLLSPYPFFGLFFKVLFGVAVLWESKRQVFGEQYALALNARKPLSEFPKPLVLSDFVEHFQEILAKLKNMRIPSMGGWSRMSLSSELTTQLSFHRPHSESLVMERRVLLLEYAAPTLFALLSVDQVLFLLGCLCCEHKVLVVSDHVNIVSSCVLALITLLSPLQWAGPVITVLPPRLDELLEAPVPLIAGRVSINSASIRDFSTLEAPMRGVIEMNMDQNNLTMHDEDLRNYHELKLPGCDALVHELKYFSMQLFQKHTGDPDFPSVQQQEACEIICTRIHRHLEFVCALALGDDGVGTSTLARAKQSQENLNSMNEPQQTQTEPARRCSDLTLDYIRRFKETQMFSMFQLQRQEQQEEAMSAAEAEDLEHGDDEDEDEDEDAAEDGLVAGDCDTDALFVDESISYEPDLMATC